MEDSNKDLNQMGKDFGVIGTIVGAAGLALTWLFPDKDKDKK